MADDQDTYEFSGGQRQSIVEVATRDQLYKNPLHPYTQAPLAEVPIADPELEGALGQQISRARSRAPCARRRAAGSIRAAPKVMEVCESVDPPMRTLDDGRAVACHLHAA